MIQISVGLDARVLNQRVAAWNAAHEALRELRKATPNLILVFSSPVYNPEEVVKSVRNVFRSAPIVSAAAEYQIGFPKNSDSGILVLAFAGFNAVKISPGAVLSESTTPPDLFLILTAAGFNSRVLLKQIGQKLGPAVPIFGGVFSKIFFENQTPKPAAVGISLFGKLSLGFGFAHGYAPAGLKKTITKTTDGLVEEINGAPALDFYRSYLGEQAVSLLKAPFSRVAFACPLAISTRDLLQFPVRSTDAESLILSLGAEEGETVGLMIGDREAAVKSAQEAVKEALIGLKGKKPRFALIAESLIRAKLLGTRLGEEYLLFRKILGADVPIAGFSGLGEIKNRKGFCELQSGGISVLLSGD